MASDAAATGNWLERAKPDEIASHLRQRKQAERDEYDYTFATTVHPGQFPPESDWRICAGDGRTRLRQGKGGRGMGSRGGRSRSRRADRARRRIADRSAQRDGGRRKRPSRLLPAAQPTSIRTQPAARALRQRSTGPALRRQRSGGAARAAAARLQGQTQKEFIVNEAHALLDTLLYPVVEGECWLVGADATGDWAGHDGEIASRQPGGWVFVGPRDGMRAFDKASGQAVLFAGSWRRITPPANPIGGTTVDAEARTAIGEIVSTLQQAGILPAA